MSNSENKEQEPVAGRDDKLGRVPMLTLWCRDDRFFSFSYAYLLNASFAKDVIHLDFGFCEVQLTGVKLGQTYRSITLHQFDVVREVDAAAIPLEEQGVRRIEVVWPKGKEEGAK